MQFKVESLLSIFDVGVAGAFGMLHFLLFLFYPREKTNLFFSIFAVGLALRALSADVFETNGLSSAAVVALNITAELSLVLAVFAFGKFLYAAFEEKTPFHYWLTAVLWVIAVAVQYFSAATFGNFRLSGLILIAFITIESLRVVGRALIRGKDGAWIVGLGVLLVVISPLKDAVRILSGNDAGIFWNTFFNQVSICGIIVANSVYLARNFARTNRNLEIQLEQVKQLSAREIEHERTAAELRLQNEQERARLALVEQELDLAANIQQALFPEELPEIEGYDIAAFNRAAKVCGGDYYDVLRLSENSVLFCVADVSGKGLPAALLMSSMQATLRALAGRTASLTELAARTNELLFAASPSNKFITAIFLEIEPQTGKARYVNAGHNECILLGKDGHQLLKSTGLPLGMLGGMRYEEKTIISKLIKEIDAFAADAAQHDDITLLIIKSLNKRI